MEQLAAVLFLALRLGMVLALFGFLGWAILGMWRDLKRQVDELDERQVPAITLAANEGEEAAQRFTLSEITVGRHASCEWVLNHDTVSSRHARLSFHHEHWWLQDLDSRNGTFLNGERVQEAIVLAPGDTVRCGQAAFTISLG